MCAVPRNEKNGQDGRRLAAQRMKWILLHFRGQMDERLRPEGVTTAQFMVLKAIRNELGASGAQLARACHITPQSAQALLKSLEDGGCIVRTKDAVNDRILIAKLTPRGEKLLETGERVARAIENKLWEGIPETAVESLNKTLVRCLTNLEGGPS
ncbi:MAG TPA: MarR family transcriptional regulator [Edaphobacter sp.]|jgi:DNA-binding MarR family transcriptional regulator|nr:MarR family transcriptional regulator [Edaphobacter sp.]